MSGKTVLIVPHDEVHSIRAELVEMNASYVMVKMFAGTQFWCFPWHQIKRLEYESDPRWNDVNKPYTGPDSMEHRSAPYGTWTES